MRKRISDWINSKALPALQTHLDGYRAGTDELHTFADEEFHIELRVAGGYGYIGVWQPFAKFNSYPHLDVEIPPGGFTISTRTPDGKRVTFCWLPTTEEPNSMHHCIDIKYCDAAAPKAHNGDVELPVMHMIAFGPGNTTCDTRRSDKPTTLATILIGDQYYEKGTGSSESKD